MADPARYYIDPVLNLENETAGLHIERSVSGDWVKWSDFEDYKAGRRRNSTEDAVTKLGVENAELRGLLATLQKNEDQYIWRVSVGNNEWVCVKTAKEALLLGRKFAELTAKVGKDAK